MPRALARRAQRRIALEIAGLDDDTAIGSRRGGEHALHGRREIAAAGLDPDGAAATEQRHRVGFLDQPLGLVGECVALDAGEREGVADILDRTGDQRDDAFPHQPRIGSVHQDDRSGRIGSGDETVDVGVLDRHHGRSLRCRRRRTRRAAP